MLVYKYVLQNQEKSVILPLKVGNKWIYQVSQYNSTGAVTDSYLDSIVVIEEVIEKGEKWFVVYYAPGRNGLKCSNTDIGLLSKCDIDCDYRWLIAHYPVKSKSYLAHVGSSTYDGSNQDTLKKLIINYDATVDLDIPATLGLKNVKAIKYSTFISLPDKPENGNNLAYEDYFVPDYGLIENKQYGKSGSNSYLKIYIKLISSNVEYK